VAGKMAAVNQFRDPAPEGLQRGLQQLTAPVELVRSRRFVLKTGDFTYELDLLDLDAFLRYGKFVWVDGDPERIQPPLIDGQGVLISEVFANRTGLQVGDRYAAQVERFAVDLPVLGIVRDYRTRGGVVFYDRGAFSIRYGDPSWSTARLFFRQPPEDLEAAMASLRREIIDRCGSHLDIIAGAELRSAILRVFDETFAVTFVLLLIALSIAALGITTTLAVQVLERLTQFNTLIAVGAAIGQIRAIVFWEALMLIAAGEIAGLVCGFMLSYLLIYVVNVQSFGWSFIYSVDWKALAASLPLIVATAMLAALPAIRLIFSQPPAMLLRDR
jgi:putative ABC transport system permease protein